MSQGGEWTCVSAKKKKSPSKPSAVGDHRKSDRERGGGAQPSSAKDNASFKAVAASSPSSLAAAAADSHKERSKSNGKSTSSGGDSTAAATPPPPFAPPPSVKPPLPLSNNFWGQRQAAAAALLLPATESSAAAAAAAVSSSSSSSVLLFVSAPTLESAAPPAPAPVVNSALSPPEAAAATPPSHAADIVTRMETSTISSPDPAPATIHSQSFAHNLEDASSSSSSSSSSAAAAAAAASSSSSSTAPKSWASLVRAGSANSIDQRRTLALASASSSLPSALSVQVDSPFICSPAATHPQDTAKLQLQAIGAALCQCARDLQKGKELSGAQLKTPRGLVNRGNMCFVNAVWQMLLLVPPLLHVLRTLNIAANRHFSIGQPFPSSLPVLRSMCAFVATLDEAVAPAPFSPPRTKNKNKQQQQPAPAPSKGLPLDIPPAIAPEELISSLSMFCPDDHVSSKGKSRQEDAHEYISWLLAAADDEMRAVMSLVLDAEPQSPAAQDVSAAEATAAAAVSHEADGEWETVGKRSGGGGLVTQVISRSSTPLALIFSGSLATSVHRQGARGACSFSPFWFLAVDFAPDAAHDSTRVAQATQGHASASSASHAPALHLEELLAASFKKNAVDTGEVSVSHVLQQLPKVLLLHVKRFALRDDKIVKISQALQIAPLLQMKRAWMLGAQEQQQQYRLTAAVLHHGQGLGRGHYTAVCKVNAQQWIHWDDSCHRLISETEALQMAGDAYLLMFFLK